MQILEAALAFAITMLVLSLICSSFVEMIHRIVGMREAGLKYMLERMFDQALNQYFEKYKDKIPEFAAGSVAQMRASFVERMSANRAPMGAIPRETPSPAANVTAPAVDASGGRLASLRSFYARIRLWNGRDLSSMTPSEFMERLGGTEFGAAIKSANESLGREVADTADAVLKDVAQKFEALGKEASSYFEGRARLLSVLVAVAFAFAIRADAIEIFNTYLRDPNARNTVIEQSKVVTAQYEAATKAAEALKAIAATNPPDDVKAQIEALKKDWQAKVENTRSTVKQYADLGLPIGWTKDNATLRWWALACNKAGSAPRLVSAATECVGADGEKPGKVKWEALRLAFSLILGGILIGLGAPFWYNAVTGLTNIRNIAKELTGGGAKATDTARVPGGTDAGPDKPQPATPVGAFKVARAAAEASATQAPG